MEMYAFHAKHLPATQRSDQHTLSPYCIRRHFVKWAYNKKTKQTIRVGDKTLHSE